MVAMAAAAVSAHAHVVWQIGQKDGTLELWMGLEPNKQWGIGR